ncbi:MAG: hypothetical protein AAFP04_12500 [Myxococcota bacterium]
MVHRYSVVIIAVLSQSDFLQSIERDASHRRVLHPDLIYRIELRDVLANVLCSTRSRALSAAEATE